MLPCAAAAKEAAQSRRGKSFDPEVAAAAVEVCGDAAFWQGMQEHEPCNAVLDLGPSPPRYVDQSGLDDLAYALADIVDLKSTTAATHSTRTAELAEAMAERPPQAGPDSTARQET